LRGRVTTPEVLFSETGRALIETVFERTTKTPANKVINDS
jgi:hypothetical protein